MAAAAALLLLLPALSATDDWADAHATFYGDETGAETMRKKAAAAMAASLLLALGFYFGVDRSLVANPWSLVASHGIYAEGACGYGNLFDQGYGLDTTALSVALFNQGWSCGGCYAVRCQGSAYCAPGGAPATVTATNLCPANYSKPSGNWCNPPLRHFDLSKPPMFLRLVRSPTSTLASSPCSTAAHPAPGAAACASR